MWNVYQPDTFRLDKRLTGVGSFAVELNTKVHIKGFQFTPPFPAPSIRWPPGSATPLTATASPARARRCWASATTSRSHSAAWISAKTAAAACACAARSALPANTVHLLFDSEGPGGSERRIVEFGPPAGLGRTDLPLCAGQGQAAGHVSCSCPAPSSTLTALLSWGTPHDRKPPNPSTPTTPPPRRWTPKSLRPCAPG